MVRLVVASFLLALGCGGVQQPSPREEGARAPREAPSTVFSPTEGGPLVRMQRLVLAAGESLSVPLDRHQEVFLFVESGQLSDHPAGSVVRARGAMEFAARGETAVIAALVEGSSSFTESASTAEVRVVSSDATAVLSSAGGELRVQIFHDEASGAANGAFSLLDADADLDVPEHVHETSVEVLYIVSGDGTMLLGDERFTITPGQVIYIPADTNHGYEHGTEPLRALQVYAPPGPEQRFRNLSEATSAPETGAN